MSKIDDFLKSGVYDPSEGLDLMSSVQTQEAVTALVSAADEETKKAQDAQVTVDNLLKVVKALEKIAIGLI